MKHLILLITLSFLLTMCNVDNEQIQAQSKTSAFGSSEFMREANFYDDETGMVYIGTYIGPEFSDEGDVGHQFSNHMCSLVGQKLKFLYDEGFYSKVDMSRIFMSTEGMGSGTVKYKCVIPMYRVDTKCEAMTSFDHVGGWNHAPALESRKRELGQVLLKGDSLHISDLKTTPEGLQEYWIQWRNYKKQAECKQ
jgi:hypothetical protein